MKRYTEVNATEEELTQWRKRKGNEGRYFPSVARVQCDDCGKRLWGSGLGLGSHSRACKGAPEENRQFCRTCLRSAVPAVTLAFNEGSRLLHWCEEHASDADAYRVMPVPSP